MAISKFQKFKAVTISRDKIKNAAYNPRKISEDNKKALRKSLRKNGLVETLVWNKRTGNLVGGHQRLSQIDLLEGKQDYELTVAEIDVDDKQEKEINIILNNQSVQGEYDFDVLKDVFQDIDIKNTGFTDYDLSVMGVDWVVDNIEETKETKTNAEKIAEIKAVKKASKDKSNLKGENYFIVTFEDYIEKEKFLIELGHEKDDRYIDGLVLKSYIKK